ncbi:MAG: hypothetical protein CSYNP_03731 [Syntrophus sp. SKADARSKE-3]|nr:hypothetical protein [Syntrophus sp. SKADARSKE-3]
MIIKQRKFRFVSSALKPEAFEVISFVGSEGLSKLYRFEILLVSDKPNLDLEKIIYSKATLTILRTAGDIDFHGILISFEQLLSVGGQSRYRAILAPFLWRLTMTHHNQVFLARTVPQIIESVLKDGGLSRLDYEFRLLKDYPEREYVCMYNESHFSFITRWMEREGIYFCFEQNADREKLIIIDSASVHPVMKESDKMTFSPVSGLDENTREGVIKTISCVQKALPAWVMLKDYNYSNPLLELSAVHQVSERGSGDVYIYGEHFKTPEEGAYLAKLRAEELKCRAKVFHGESLIPYLRPGYTFLLTEHFREDFNARYLTTNIEHNGNQAFYFSAGLGQDLSEREEMPYYRNSFSAILSGSQFRPERVTEKPLISGMLNAHIDAAGSGKYAELDEHGRYKVLLPFDLSDRPGGKASSRVRMAQPYAGSNHGMHFPLRKGTEVLLTFIDGDPDRPIISAAVTNPLTPSPVTNNNHTSNIIRSSAGNRMEMEDEEGSERVRFSTPHMNTFLHLGAPSLLRQGSLRDASINEVNDSHFTLSTDGTGIINTGENITVKTDAFMETTVGNTATPAMTETFFDCKSSTSEVRTPIAGDYYMTTRARHVLNAGTDMVIQVSGNNSEVINGTKSVRVKDKAYETYEKDVKKYFMADLRQEVQGNHGQIVTKDSWSHVHGDKWSKTLGCKHSVMIGEQFDLNIGAFNAVYCAERRQLNLINNNVINVGALMNIILGARFDIEGSVALKSGKTKIEKSNFKESNFEVDINKNESTLSSSCVSISRNDLLLYS